MSKFRQNLTVFIFILAFILLLYYAYLKGYWPEESVTCPISYDGSIIIRNDSFGEGYFGAKRRGGRIHKGIDLWAPAGTPVMAYRRGKVVETGNHPGGYGKYVEIAHKDGFVTIYAHLSEISVEEGEFVRCGQTIGKSGKTGNASHSKIEPHVHFEIIKDTVPVDPMVYLQKK